MIFSPYHNIPKRSHITCNLLIIGDLQKRSALLPTVVAQSEYYT